MIVVDRFNKIIFIILMFHKMAISRIDSNISFVY